MNMRRDGQKKPDALVLLARASARKRRKRSPVGIMIALALVVLLLALIAWWSWPAREAPPLIVIAPDQLAVAGEPVTLRAWLRPQEEKDADADLEGFDLYFADSLLGGGEAKGRLQEKAATGADGEAAVRWRPPAGEQPHFFVVRYPGDKRHGKALDEARVYTWPADSRLLIVEARHGLMTAREARKFPRVNIFDVRPRLGAAAALATAREKRYRIVYLAVAPGRPEMYRKLRGWLQRRSATARSLFPDGPVLARADYGEGSDAAAAGRALLRRLKKQFKGPLIAVVGRGEDAQAFRAERLTTFVVGASAGGPAAVKRVKSWAELAEQLP